MLQAQLMVRNRGLACARNKLTFYYQIVIFIRFFGRFVNWNPLRMPSFYAQNKEALKTYRQERDEDKKTVGLGGLICLPYPMAKAQHQGGPIASARRCESFILLRICGLKLTML
jgi:hypothetical protein